MIFILMIILCFSVVSFTDIGKDSFSSLMQRTRTSGGIGDRLADAFTPFKYFSSAGMVGFGIGTTYQGSGRFISDFKDMPTTFEEETERIFLEIGLIGFMILMILRIVLLLYTYRVLKKFKDKDLKIILTLVFIYQIPIVVGLNNIVFNSLQNAIYWFLIGLVVCISKLNYETNTQNIVITSRKTAFVPTGFIPSRK